MSAHANANGAAAATATEMVVVRVTDAIDFALTGRDGHTYKSPPQSRAQALALVGLLLGRPASELDGKQRWSCPVAGGRRTISIDPAVASGLWAREHSPRA